MTALDDDRCQRNEYYRAGLCVTGCGRPYSPGRPRCNDCHRAHIPVMEPGLTRRQKKGKAA
jgi:hypothetical protein